MWSGAEEKIHWVFQKYLSAVRTEGNFGSQVQNSRSGCAKDEVSRAVSGRRVVNCYRRFDRLWNIYRRGQADQEGADVDCLTLRMESRRPFDTQILTNTHGVNSGET